MVRAPPLAVPGFLRCLGGALIRDRRRDWSESGGETGKSCCGSQKSNAFREAALAKSETF